MTNPLPDPQLEDDEQDPGALSALLGPRFADALQFAYTVHHADARKGGGIPYLGHLLSVCGLVLADGGGEDEAIAALLHDTLEDHPREVTRDNLRQRFGLRVLELVLICTDTAADYQGGKREDWHLRKRRYVAHLAGEYPVNLRVPLADKLDNARSVLADYRVLGDRLWSRFHAGKADQLWFYTAVVDAFEQAGVQSPMLGELRKVVAELGAAVLNPPG